MTMRAPKEVGVRQGFVSARTAQSNQIRGLLSEFGIVMPKGIASLKRRMPEILSDAENGLPGSSRELFAHLYAHLKELSRQVEELERQIKAWHRENTASQRLERFLGLAAQRECLGGDARAFKNGRQFAAWLGLVPRQHSSGGKERLLGISKRGDTYLRTLLIHGARSVLLRLKRHADQAEGWLARLVARRNPKPSSSSRCQTADGVAPAECCRLWHRVVSVQARENHSPGTAIRAARPFDR